MMRRLIGFLLQLVLKLIGGKFFVSSLLLTTYCLADSETDKDKDKNKNKDKDKDKNKNKDKDNDKSKKRRRKGQ